MRQLIAIAIIAILLSLAAPATAQVSYPLKTFLPIVINNSVEGQVR